MYFTIRYSGLFYKDIHRSAICKHYCSTNLLSYSDLVSILDLVLYFNSTDIKIWSNNVYIRHTYVYEGCMINVCGQMAALNVLEWGNDEIQVNICIVWTPDTHICSLRIPRTFCHPKIWIESQSSTFEKPKTTRKICLIVFWQMWF